MNLAVGEAAATEVVVAAVDVGEAAVEGNSVLTIIVVVVPTAHSKSVVPDPPSTVLTPAIHPLLQLHTGPPAIVVPLNVAGAAVDRAQEVIGGTTVLMMKSVEPPAAHLSS